MTKDGPLWDEVPLLHEAAEKAPAKEPAAKEPPDDLAATSAAKTPAGPCRLDLSMPFDYALNYSLPAGCDGGCAPVGWGQC